ncbi:hypothetical protein CERSUDRAFT_78621 [Gelatoporia subvermispora B]|uniref:Uncharacterized protein n=1 Tax=Ceriporiopsis subvermispora (strain B) TaxID=914234 RepID=M2Q1T9_CERS8|nr:hypothetical protein CERSUDRAFT_78621 [Gelatoporia subvermispora B]
MSEVNIVLDKPAMRVVVPGDVVACQIGVHTKVVPNGVTRLLRDVAKGNVDMIDVVGVQTDKGIQQWEAECLDPTRNKQGDDRRRPLGLVGDVAVADWECDILVERAGDDGRSRPNGGGSGLLLPTVLMCRSPSNAKLAYTPIADQTSGTPIPIVKARRCDGHKRRNQTQITHNGAYVRVIAAPQNGQTLRHARKGDSRLLLVITKRREKEKKHSPQAYAVYSLPPRTLCSISRQLKSFVLPVNRRTSLRRACPAVGAIHEFDNVGYVGIVKSSGCVRGLARVESAEDVESVESVKRLCAAHGPFDVLMADSGPNTTCEWCLLDDVGGLSVIRHPEDSEMIPDVSSAGFAEFYSSASPPTSALLPRYCMWALDEWAGLLLIVGVLAPAVRSAIFWRKGKGIWMTELRREGHHAGDGLRQGLNPELLTIGAESLTDRVPHEEVQVIQEKNLDVEDTYQYIINNSIAIPRLSSLELFYDGFSVLSPSWFSS